MTDTTETTSNFGGLEMQFVSEYGGWDKLDTTTLVFYDTKPLDHVKKLLGDKLKGYDTVDMVVSMEESYVEFSVADGEPDERGARDVKILATFKLKGTLEVIEPTSN